jgi:hypothetical protein
MLKLKVSSFHFLRLQFLFFRQDEMSVGGRPAFSFLCADRGEWREFVLILIRGVRGIRNSSIRSCGIRIIRVIRTYSCKLFFKP